MYLNVGALMMFGCAIFAFGAWLGIRAERRHHLTSTRSDTRADKFSRAMQRCSDLGIHPDFLLDDPDLFPNGRSKSAPGSTNKGNS